MHWKLKCLAFHTVARVPAIYRGLQKHITGRYFLTVTASLLEAHQFHIRNFSGGTALEFGAGSNLLCPLLLSNAGATSVIALDIERLAAVERVNHVIRQLRELLPGEWPYITDLDQSLWAAYRIRYLAPADMRATKLPGGSIDFICSTSTLEHIPREDIEAILKECLRILSPHGLMSHIVDYHDHYATADNSISRFNFYRYPDRRWRFFNPPAHYQNRLRHSDFVQMFHAFSITHRAVIPDEPIDVPLASRFAHYSYQDLQAKNGLFTLHTLSPYTAKVM